jgi:ADP-ribose pyrophosphatase
VTRPNRFRVSRRERILDLGFLDITKRTIESPDGTTFERIVIEHPGAVAVVPLLGDDVVLLNQYRAACGDMILEIPAGKLDQHAEDPQDAARRELAEETGYTAGHLHHLTDLWTSVGFCDERISVFVADDLEPGIRRPMGPEEMAAEVIRMPLDKALGLVASGTIADAKTVVGLLLAARSRVPT